MINMTILFVFLIFIVAASEARPKPSCGLVLHDKSKKDGWRVLNGEDSTTKQWPWVVHLYTEGYVCGATLIDKYTIISAAHCGRHADADPNRMMIAIGSTEWNGIPNYHYYQADKVIMHEEYDPPNESHGADIMIVKLSRAVDESAPICLPEADAKFDGNGDCFVAGWGETEDWEISQKLKHARLPIVDNKECSSHQGGTIESNKICAGGKGANPCWGDTGGPLMCRNAKTRVWELAGIVSWGHETCKADGRPTVFTRVTSYMEWIEKNRHR